MIQLTLLHAYQGPSPWADEAAIVVRAISRAGLPAWTSERCAAVRAKCAAWSLVAVLDEVPTPGDGVAAVLGTAHWLLNEIRGCVTTAKQIPARDGSLLILGFHDAALSMDALQLANWLFENIEGLDPAQIHTALQDFWIKCKRLHPDYQVRILQMAARTAGVPFLRFVAEERFWQFGWGARSRIFMESGSNADGFVSFLFSKNKVLGKRVFAALGLPTPLAMVINSAQDVSRATAKVGFPCVVKPIDGGGGRGVMANLRTERQVLEAVAYARLSTQGPLLIEEFVPGDDHRLMVVGGKFVAAIRREASRIVGDGRCTVSQLIDAANVSRTINLHASYYRRPIRVDTAALAHIAAQGYQPGDALPAGRTISVRSNSNLSTGGVCVDMTEQTHPEIRRLVEELAQTAGLSTAGVDYITTDISQAPADVGGAFIEMNTTPGLDVCVASGWSPEKIGTLVLGSQVGRIPVQLHVVDVLSADTQSHCLQLSADDGCTAVAGSTLYLSGSTREIAKGRPWAAVEAALRNKVTQSLHVFAAREHLMTHGLPLDRFDRIRVACQPLPQAWVAVLKRCSASVDSAFKPSNSLSEAKRLAGGLRS